MLQNIYLLNYKNYYERIAERTPAVTKLQSSEVLSSVLNYNFNENDGINTEIVINNREIDHEVNYCIVQDNDTYSCWYIIECKRNLRGQVTFTLRRDILDDYLDEWLNSTAFVEKGIAADGDNAVFNNEQLTYNQIKSEEIPLQDNSNCQWLVGYFDKKQRSSITLQNFSIEPYVDLDLSSTNLEAWEYYPISGKNGQSSMAWGYVNSVDLEITRNGSNDTSTQFVYDYSENTLTTGAEMGFQGRYRWTLTAKVRNALQSNMNNIIASVRQARSEIAQNCILSDADFNEVQNLNNKLVKFANGIYKVLITTTELDTAYIKPSYNSFQFVKGAVDTVAIDEAIIAGGGSVYNANIITNCYYHLNGTMLVMNLVDYQSIVTPEKTYSMSLGSATSNYETSDAPYGVFAIPYTDEIINGVQQNKELNMALCSKLLTDYQGKIYDIQLLPFCPNEDWLLTANSKSYTLITDNNNNSAGTIFYPQTIQCSNTINQSIAVDNYKIENETTFYRLTSPNYDGQFEFSAAKNNGVDFFNVDMTLKPYSPYIHVNPNFKRLYGNNYKDSRGLICGGNFSLTQMTDQWQQYELNNKNYQRQFDRQIENMEFNNSKAREQEAWQIAAGTVQAGIGGAQAGMLGGGVAAGIGAGIGAATSLAAGIADAHINEQLRNEALDFTKDNFQMQMGNIKALPRTINKLDAFTANTKPYVFLEKYTCSDIEKEMLAKKIVWNGMTINRIGKPLEYEQLFGYGDINNQQFTYLKGQIIRTNADGDYHLWTSLAAEFNKGVYLKYGE